jgi:hypothetical protein
MPNDLTNANDLTITIHLPSTELASVQNVQAWLEQLDGLGVEVTVDGPSPGDLDRRLEAIARDLDAYIVQHPEANVSSERARIEEVRRVNRFLRERGRPTTP